jgi:hypothetical protein
MRVCAACEELAAKIKAAVPASTRSLRVSQYAKLDEVGAHARAHVDRDSAMQEFFQPYEHTTAIGAGFALAEAVEHMLVV